MTAPTYRDWAERVLGELAAEGRGPVLEGRWRWLVAWAQLEDTEARYNPLATTLRLHGSTRFNSAGVQEFPSLGLGVRAVVWTLRTCSVERGYDRVEGALLDPGASFPDFRGAVSRSAWSGLPRDGAHYLISEHDPSWDDRVLPGAGAVS